MKLLKDNLDLILLLCMTLASLSAVHADVVNRSVLMDCHDSGGGYIDQTLKVNWTDNNQLEFFAERYTKVPEIVSNVGIQLDGKLAKNLKVVLPKEHCILKPTAQSHITLLACSTAISKIRSEVEWIDGRKETIVLGDNNHLEAFQVDTESVYKSRTNKVLRANLQLGKSPQTTELGFDLNWRCKK